MFLGFRSGVDEVSVLTWIWRCVTGCFVSDVSILQFCMCTEIFFFIDFTFSRVRAEMWTYVSFAVVGIGERCHMGQLFITANKMSYSKLHVSWISNWVPFPPAYKIVIHHLFQPSDVCPRSCLSVHSSNRKLFSSISIPQQDVSVLTWIIRRKGWLNTVNPFKHEA